MTKKFLSVLLAVLMVVAMVPVGAMAASEDPTEVTADNASNLTAGSYRISANLQADVTVTSGVVNLEIPAGVTLSNKSGHTITVSSGATLNVTGDGIVDNTVHGKGAIFNNGGTVNLTGCTFQRSAEAGTAPTEENPKGNANGNSWYTIRNQGTYKMTIDGATVKNSGGFSSMICCYSEDSNDTALNGTLEIKSGTFEGGLNSVINKNGSILKISGGTFSNTAQAVIFNDNEATISDGTFTISGVQEPAIYNRIGAGTNSKGSMTISGGTFEAATDVPAVKSVKDSNNNASGTGTLSITGGTFSSKPDDNYIDSAYIAVEEDGKYIVKDAVSVGKAELIPAILEAMGGAEGMEGAPLHDTRTEGNIADDKLYTAETYKVVASSIASNSDLEADIKAEVEVEGLVGHQNADDPASMGYWVGVKFPVATGWTITNYQRDDKEAVAITDSDLTTGDNEEKTLNAYYNVGDKEVDNPRQRPVVVTYKKGTDGPTVEVNFIVDLSGVAIVIPAAEPETNGKLDDKVINDITSAITAAATGNSENHEETGEVENPTVSIKTTGDGIVTVDKGIVEALKTAAEGDGNGVDLKIVGQDGAEATLSAETAKKLDAGKDLKPTVKAEAASEDVAESIEDEATKAVVTSALTTLGEEGKYVVTVTMQQGTEKMFTTTVPGVAITVKVPVPDDSFDTVVHITDDGNVTTEAAEKGGDEESGYYLTVKISHLSQLFGAKSSEVSDIPADPGELGAAKMPKVSYTNDTEMTDAVTGINGTINKNDVYSGSGVLVVKNTSDTTQRYIISVGPKATANTFNIAYVAKLDAGEQYVIQCQQTLAVKVVGVGLSTNLQEEFKMEDFDVDGWVDVTSAATSYPGVTAD